MNLHVSVHLFCLIVALILGILASFNITSPKFNTFAGAFTFFIIGQFFS